MNAVPHLFMVCTVNMTRLRQHWQIRNTTALPCLSTVTGCSKCVWTEELSDLGLQPQARTHGTGMASLPRALCALLMKVRYTQLKEHNRTDGWMADLNSFWTHFAWAMRCSSAAPPRWALFVGEGMQLVSQQCELSMDMHAAHSDLIDMLDAWIQMHRCLFQIRTLSEMLFQLTIIKKSLS